MEEETGNKKQANKVHVLGILAFFSTHGFHVPITGFSTSHVFFLGVLIVDFSFWSNMHSCSIH